MKKSPFQQCVFYIPGSTGKIGDGFMKTPKLQKLLYEQQRQQSKKFELYCVPKAKGSSKKAKQRRRNRGRRRRAKRARTQMKLTAAIDNLHYDDAIKPLCKSFDNILIPSFGTSRMVRKVNDKGQRRCLRKQTVRQMQCDSHYKFRQRLINTAATHGCRVFVVRFVTHMSFLSFLCVLKTTNLHIRLKKATQVRHVVCVDGCIQTWEVLQHSSVDDAE
jgi:hypothetical protein